MAWFKQLRLSWIILSVVALRVSYQELISTLHEGNHTCQGEEVIFTCTIRRPSTSSVIAVAWSSPEYIGQSGSLQLSTENMIGHVETRTGMDGNITATATVTNNTIVNGERILESMLRITAVVASMVTCTGTSGVTASIKFTVSAVPGVPQRVSAAEILQPHDNLCIILVQWDPPANSDPSDIDQYRVYVPSRNIRNDVSSSTIFTITITVMNCGDDVHVQVAAVNRGCEGMNSSEVPPILLDIPTVPTANGSTSSEGGSTPTSNPLGAGAIIGIAIGSAVGGTIIIMIICCLLMIILFCIIYSNRCRNCWRRKSSKTTDISCNCLPRRRSRSTTGISCTCLSRRRSRSTTGISCNCLPRRRSRSTTGYVLSRITKEAIIQAKECYKKQSKYDIGELDTKRVLSVPIWIDEKLDHTWKGGLREAVEAINEAAPGLSLSITEDNLKDQAIIHVLATDKKEAYTEGSILMRFTPAQADYITKIHLGKLKERTKNGISTRELFIALGFRLTDNLGLTCIDPLSITLYRSKKTYDSARRRDPTLKQNPTKENTILSELDKVGLNLVYPPCICTTADSTRYKYMPRLGTNGMYYCGRRVMSGCTYPGDNDGVCGPSEGPNCPACRTIKSPKVEEILKKKKWQGMTGRVYCGRILDEHHDRVCGIDNGPACPDCDDLLNNEC